MLSIQTLRPSASLAPRKEWLEAFSALNKAWIERFFRLEECDLFILSDPKTNIIDKGGCIFIAVLDGQPVGCCALIPHDASGTFELAKMAVAPSAQGKGIGWRLGSTLISEAAHRGVKKLFLEANTKLEASVRLYERLGFKAVSDYKAAYERCNLFMERAVEPDAARYALLISGGVDSAVACHLLCEQGIRPDLFYIKIGMQGEGTTCSAEEDIELSTIVAKKYGLSLQVVDLQQEYHERVTAYVVERIRRGLTPNPDVMCNRLIKFGAFEEKAGYRYDYIATGHYAQTFRDQQGHLWLAPAPDPVKDQSDFLSQLTDVQAEKLCFPIGALPKSHVRAIAEKERLAPAHRKDSQGICFLGKIDYNAYLAQLLGEKEGDVVERETRKVIGKHRGYWFHTIGQRKGLGLGGGPWFVVDKDTKRNIVYVSHTESCHGLYGMSFHLAGFHFITSDPWHGASEADVLFKIRHTTPPIAGHLMRQSDGRFLIESSQPLQGIAPGQFGVLYTADGNICAGSGEIR